MFKACIGLNCARQIDFIDRRGCQLVEIPEDIYRHEGYLEELLLDSNNIQELPAKIFRLTNLRKLTLSENDVMRLPPMIANYSRLLELDISKNCIEEIPSNLQFCRSLSFLDFSCNPLLRIPDCVANVTSLTQLFMNDVALPALPREIGNLQNLIVLEARENLLRRIPLSIGELKKLQRLDLGNNEIEALPSSFGFLYELVELWLDSNCLSLLPEELSNLRKLTVLDVTKNKLERLPSNFACLVNLCDLHASENCIEVLPDDFGSLRSLNQLKLDLNHLVAIPDSIGNIPGLVEVFLFENMLESVPPSLFTIPSLVMLNIDRNHLSELPNTVGRCKSLHILSLRENDISFLPDEIGQLDKLRVLDISGNRIGNLPLTVSNLNLDALWISGNQLQPLTPLQQTNDPENTEKRVLTCQYLPQKEQFGSDLDYDGSDLESEEGGTFRRGRTNSSHMGQFSVAFEPGTAGLPVADENTAGKLVRFPTPFRKDLKNRHKKPKLDARPRTTVFRKGSMDDLTIHAVDVLGEPSPSLQDDRSKTFSPTQPPTPINENDKHGANNNGPLHDSSSNLSKMKGIVNLSAGYLADGSEKTQDSNEEKQPSQPKTKLRSIEVVIDLIKDPTRGLGFSIAGGKGSTPAYEDVDESIFITRIIRGGVAEKDGRLRLGDKMLSVNNEEMLGATHMQAVAALRNSHKKCILKVSREVLIVLPENSSIDDESIDLLEYGGTGTGDTGRSVESLSLSTGTRKSVTEASTGQHVDNSNINEEPNNENGAQNGNEDATEQLPKTNSLTILDLETEPHASKKTYNTGEAVLLDSDKDSTPVENDFIIVAAEISDVSSLETEQILDQDHSDRQSDHGENDQRQPSRSDSGLETPNFIEETVVLDRSIPALGMSIVGGVDYCSKIFGCGQPGIYISKVSQGGSAAVTGRLKMGDKILKVNGIDMESATHEEAVLCLVSQQGNIELHVRHEPSPPGLQEVIITKGENKLGVSIKGGGPESIGNPFDTADEGIFISKISKGGMAESNGKLEVGQRILEVDTHSLLGASHVEAVHILRQTENTVRLLVCDGYGIRSNVINSVIDKDSLRAGSMELLDQHNNNRRVNVKRTQSNVTSDSFKKLRRDPANKMSDSEEFNKILEDLTKYQGEISAIFPEENTNDSHKEMAEEICVVAEMNIVYTENPLEENPLEDTPLEENPLEETPLEENPLEETTLKETTLEAASLDEPEEMAVEKLKEKTLVDNSNNNNLTIHKRDNADNLARQRTEKQEELKSIISEVFSDIDDWDIVLGGGKMCDTEPTEENIPEETDPPSEKTPVETDPPSENIPVDSDPPSASELSDDSRSNSDIKIFTDVHRSDEDQKEMESNLEEKKETKVSMDVSLDQLRSHVDPDSIIIHASSVPPTPTQLNMQKEWPVDERPRSVQGKEEVTKPKLQSPEKLSFKDKLAFHQKKVLNVSKEIEEMKRRSWAPDSFALSRSNTTSPAVSPTHKYSSTTNLRTNKMSPEREERRIMRHAMSGIQQHDNARFESCSSPNILNQPQILPITTDPISPSDSNITDTLISPSSDPPLTDTPTSSTNELDDPGFSPTTFDVITKNETEDTTANTTANSIVLNPETD